MKIDFTAVITDLKGRVLNERGEVWRERQPDQEPRDGDDKMTLGLVCATALNAASKDEKSYKKAVERFALMERIYGPKAAAEVEVDLKASDITLIQEALPQVYSPLIVGRADALLEPAAKAA